MPSTVDQYLQGLGSYGQMMGHEENPFPEGSADWRRWKKASAQKRGFMSTTAPERYRQLGGFLSEMNRVGTDLTYEGQIEGMAGEYGEQQEDYFNQAADIGLDPNTARMQFGQLGQGFQQRAGAARSQAYGGMAQREGEIGAGVTDAIQRSIDFQRMMDLQRYMASRARRAARHAGDASERLGWASAATMGVSGGGGSQFGGAFTP